MTPKTRRRRFQTEVRDGMAVVTFVDPLLDEQNSWIIREQVAELGKEKGRENLLLDFSNVKFLSSAGLGALLALHRQQHQRGGRVSLCNLPPEIRDVFRATRLDQVFDMK